MSITLIRMFDKVLQFGDILIFIQVQSDIKIDLTGTSVIETVIRGKYPKRYGEKKVVKIEEGNRGIRRVARE